MGGTLFLKQDCHESSIKVTVAGLHLLNILAVHQPPELHHPNDIRLLVNCHVSGDLISFKLSNNSMSSDTLLFGLGDMFECVPLHGDDGPDVPLVGGDFIKLLV